MITSSPRPIAPIANPTPRSPRGLPGPPRRRVSFAKLVLEGHTRNVQTGLNGPTRICPTFARVAQLAEREPSKLEVAGSRPVARFYA